MGDSKDLHVIRATAYGREDMLTKAAQEYKAALKFAPNDGALHIGLGNTSSQRNATTKPSANCKTRNGSHRRIRASTRCWHVPMRASDDRDQTYHYVQLAEQQAEAAPPPQGPFGQSVKSATLVATGEALSTLGEQKAAMERFRKALEMPQGNRVDVRLAIAQMHG